MTVGRSTFQVPLYWELLRGNRRGNPSAADRIALLQTCVQVLGWERIGLVLGDREFVGRVWLKWLRENKLPFLMRLPKHHQLTFASGRRQAVTTLGMAEENARFQLVSWNLARAYGDDEPDYSLTDVKQINRCATA